MNSVDKDVRPPVVTFHRVTKSFGRNRALVGLDLEVPRSAFLLLVGPNGAGKTTSLRLLLGLQRPDEGEIRVLGEDPTVSAASIRARCGYVPELQVLGYPWMRVSEFLRFHSDYFRSWDGGYARYLAQVLDLRVDARVKSLSKGERRRVDLVSALAHKPALLLLDEPMDGLDPLARSKVTAILAAHLDRYPTTSITSTHHIEDLNRICTHMAVIDEGRVVGQGSREELQTYLKSYRLRIPESWSGIRELGSSVLRRSGAGEEVVWTIWGEEELVVERLQEASAGVREVRPHTLEEAAVILLERGVGV